MKNKDIVLAFIKGRSGSTTNLASYCGYLVSYHTTIAQWCDNGRLIVNTTKYSTTTSHHLGMLKRLLGGYEEIPHGPVTGYAVVPAAFVIFVKDVPIGTNNLIDYVEREDRAFVL